MYWRINSPVLETLCGVAGGATTFAYKEAKFRGAAQGVGGVHIAD